MEPRVGSMRASNNPSDDKDRKNVMIKAGVSTHFLVRDHVWVLVDQMWPTNRISGARPRILLRDPVLDQIDPVMSAIEWIFFRPRWEMNSD